MDAADGANAKRLTTHLGAAIRLYGVFVSPNAQQVFYDTDRSLTSESALNQSRLSQSVRNIWSVTAAGADATALTSLKESGVALKDLK
jgi:hypothetical protein